MNLRPLSHLTGSPRRFCLFSSLRIIIVFCNCVLYLDFQFYECVLFRLVVSQHGHALHIVDSKQFLDSPEWFGVCTNDTYQVILATFLIYFKYLPHSFLISPLTKNFISCYWFVIFKRLTCLI